MTVPVWIWGVQALASVGSLVTRRPWTTLASGRKYPPQVRSHPLFAAANQRVTAAWSAYFVLAAVTTRVVGPWASLVFAAPTPLLAWLSFRYGDGYATTQLATSRTTGDEPMPDDRRSELRAQVDGKTDDEILAAALGAPGGYDGLIDETMLGMADALDPDAAEDCVIGSEIATPDAVRAYRIEIRGTSVVAERRDPTDARVVLGLSLPDYLRLISGTLDGTDAFMTGRLALRGDVMFAPQIERLFRR